VIIQPYFGKGLSDVELPDVFGVFPFLDFFILNLLMKFTDRSYGFLVTSLAYVCNLAVLNLLGKPTTSNKVVRTMVMSFTLHLINLSINLYGSAVEKMKEIIPTTEEFNKIIQEFLGIIGNFKSFDNVYVFDDDGAPSSAFARGALGYYNIYIPSSYFMRFTSDELVGVLLHETGHCYYGHATTLFFMTLIMFFILFVIGGWFILKSEFVDESFINDDGKVEIIKASTAMKLLIFSLIISPAFLITFGIIQNILKRYFEFQADKFSVMLGGGAGYLSRLGKEKSSSNSWRRMYSLFYEDHPWHSDRMKRIKKAMQK